MTRLQAKAIDEAEAEADNQPRTASSGLALRHQTNERLAIKLRNRIRHLSVCYSRNSLPVHLSTHLNRRTQSHPASGIRLHNLACAGCWMLVIPSMGKASETARLKTWRRGCPSLRPSSIIHHPSSMDPSSSHLIMGRQPLPSRRSILAVARSRQVGGSFPRNTDSLNSEHAMSIQQARSYCTSL